MIVALPRGQEVFGPFVLDSDSRVLRRNGQPLQVGQRGFDLLTALVEANGSVVTKEVLMARAWPDLFVEEANLSVQIAALRKALGKRPDGEEWITTVPRVGYRMPRSSDPQLPHLLRRPVVAVLPFATLVTDAEQAQFADGVVEDLITALSRFRTFAVASPSAAFGSREGALGCQSARNIDPRSASNIDPLVMIVGAGRTSELVRVAQAFGPRGEVVRLYS